MASEPSEKPRCYEATAFLPNEIALDVSALA